MFRKLKLNILKKDIARPRIYFIHCGLTPGKDCEEFVKCEYYRKK